MTKKDIVITSAIRTPVGSLGKTLKNIPGDELGSIVISESLKKSKIKNNTVRCDIMIQIEEMRAFVMVVETGSLTQAQVPILLFFRHSLSPVIPY